MAEQAIPYGFFGRKTLYTTFKEITPSNVNDMIREIERDHARNAGEIGMLYKRYKGEQPILNRIKEVRPDINNKIVVNRAMEVTNFSISYSFGEPMQYVARGSKAETPDKVDMLNDFMLEQNKATADIDLATWFSIGGLGYRIALPNKGSGDSPFSIYTLNPMSTGVVKYQSIEEPVVAGFAYVTDEHGFKTYSIYTPSLFMKVKNQKVLEVAVNPIGMVPIIEYQSNMVKMGVFEPVITLLDAINLLQSNRLDGVEQFVQSIMLFINADIENDDIQKLQAMGALKIFGDDASVELITKELNQSEVQVLIDDLYQSVLTIIGMPSQSGESNSTSDTGSAVIMRGGWQTAESRAKQSELMFKRSEKQLLEVILKICEETSELELKVSEIEMKFTRRNYSDLMAKSQVLTTMLANPKIHPQLAFEHCGLFVDSLSAYLMSEVYYEEVGKYEGRNESNGTSEPKENGGGTGENSEREGNVG